MNQSTMPRIQLASGNVPTPTFTMTVNAPTPSLKRKADDWNLNPVLWNYLFNNALSNKYIHPNLKNMFDNLSQGVTESCTTFCLQQELPTLIIPYLSTLPTLIIFIHGLFNQTGQCKNIWDNQTGQFSWKTVGSIIRPSFLYRSLVVHIWFFYRSVISF